MRMNDALIKVENLINKMEKGGLLDGAIVRAQKSLYPNDPVLTREFVKYSIAKRWAKTNCPILISHHDEGTKMEGVTSISTSQKANCDCKRMSQIKGSICESCYAHSYIERRLNLRVALAVNYIILTTVELEWDEIPTLYCIQGRIESFGELETEMNGGLTQAKNYVKTVLKNEFTRWGWWTKHPQLMQKAIDTFGEKPNNLQCIYSSPMLNVSTDIHKVKQVAPCIDKVFTVYTHDTVTNGTNGTNGIDINCGSAKCFWCRKCYTQNDIRYIGELKK